MAPAIKYAAAGSLKLGDHLRYQLCRGYYSPGARFYSNRSLADEFGISVPTADKVLKRLCQEGLVERLHGSGSYVTEFATSRQAATYALVAWFDSQHESLRRTERYDIFTEFEQSCMTHGRDVRLINLNDPEHGRHLQALLATRLDGALLLPPYDHPGMPPTLRALRQAGVPLVHWASSSSLDGAPDSSSAGVAFDDTQCGQVAASHLLALGHRSMAFLYQEQENQSWAERRGRSFQTVLARARIPKRQRPVAGIPAKGMTPSHLVALLQRLRQQGCTAIFAANDQLAQDVSLACRAVGLRIPEDLSLIGVDNGEIARVNGFTTVDRSALDFSRATLDLLETSPEDRSGPDPVLVPCRLVVRNSTARLPHAPPLAKKPS